MKFHPTTYLILIALLWYGHSHGQELDRDYYTLSHSPFLFNPSYSASTPSNEFTGFYVFQNVGTSGALNTYALSALFKLHPYSSLSFFVGHANGPDFDLLDITGNYANRIWLDRLFYLDLGINLRGANFTGVPEGDPLLPSNIVPDSWYLSATPGFNLRYRDLSMGLSLNQGLYLKNPSNEKDLVLDPQNYLAHMGYVVHLGPWDRLTFNTFILKGSGTHEFSGNLMIDFESYGWVQLGPVPRTKWTVGTGVKLSEALDFSVIVGKRKNTLWDTDKLFSQLSLRVKVDRVGSEPLYLNEPGDWDDILSNQVAAFEKIQKTPWETVIEHYRDFISRNKESSTFAQYEKEVRMAAEKRPLDSLELNQYFDSLWKLKKPTYGIPVSVKNFVVQGMLDERRELERLIEQDSTGNGILIDMLILDQLKSFEKGNAFLKEYSMEHIPESNNFGREILSSNNISFLIQSNPTEREKHMLDDYEPTPPADGTPIKSKKYTVKSNRIGNDPPSLAPDANDVDMMGTLSNEGVTESTSPATIDYELVFEDFLRLYFKAFFNDDNANLNYDDNQLIIDRMRGVITGNDNIWETVQIHYETVVYTIDSKWSLLTLLLYVDGKYLELGKSTPSMEFIFAHGKDFDYGIFSPRLWSFGSKILDEYGLYLYRNKLLQD